MDLIEDKKPLAAFSTPPHHHHPPPPAAAAAAMRMPPLDTSHHPAAVAAAAAAATPTVGQGIYEPSSWRPYPSSFDPQHQHPQHLPDQHRVSSTPTAPPSGPSPHQQHQQQPPSIPPPPAHAYPVIPNRELPQLPPDGPYARPSSLPGPVVTTPPDAHHPQHHHPHPHHPQHHHQHHPHHPPPHSQSQPPPPPPPSVSSAPAHPAHPAHPSHSAASGGNYRLNGSGVAGGPPPPPASLPDAPPPHSAPPEYRSRMAFPPEPPTNGDISSSSAAAAAATGALPAHSIPPAQYSSSAIPPPQTPTPFDPPGYYNSSAYGMRQRKAARAQQACDQCRARKAKCDEGRPSCSHCKENNLPCVYKEVPPHKQEKATQLLLDRMQQMEDRMEERMTQLQTIQVEHGSQLSRLLTAEAKAKEARVQQQHTPKDPARPASQKQAAEPLLKQPDMPDVLRDQETKEETTSFVIGQKIDAAEGVEEGLKDEDDGELSIPVEHTTAAHKLLMWPSIKSLLYPKEYDEDYVMKLEEGRGLIRVYGRGEGDDTSEGLQPAQPPPAVAAPASTSVPAQSTSLAHTSSHSTPTWDEGYPPSGSPTGTAPWAVAATSGPSAAAPATAAAGASTPVGSSASSVRTIDHGLEESGVFTTDPETVRRLHLSYMDHLHKLHPFLDQNDLEKKLEIFIRVYCPTARPSSASVSFMNNHTGSVGDHPHHPRGAKRKRSCETLPGAACDLPSPVGGGGVSNRSFSPRIEQSIDNAIILLVLALGSICECRDRPVPGPISDSPPDFRKEQIPGPSLMHHRPILSPAASESALPLSSSFYAAPTSSNSSGAGGAGGAAGNAGGAGGSHRFTSPSMIERQRSLPGQTTAPRDGATNDTRHLRNMDVIPGLAYYGYATQILGSLQGANGLPHVQAALLAGLYAGQLAHPFQSHGWIYQAARACQVLVRSKRYEQMTDGPLKDLYDFAYWTCLQLESDILAELDLPASGISRLEGRIALPKGRFTLSLPNEICAPSTMMMFFYSAQIHLRKVLNRVHTDLYKVEKQGQSRWSSSVQEILSMNLQLWRSSLPEVMRWKDYDPPSNDINVARMRAKYYGARYIIHRPLLYHALHIAGRATSVDSPSTAPGMAPSQSQMSPSMTHTQRAPSMSRLPSDMGGAPPVRGSTSGPVVGGWSTYNYRDLPTKLRRACKVCIDSAILSTEVFDGIEGRPVVTNIFGTAHAQFGNMLVLSATYMSSLSELVDRNVLERLLKRTIRFLLQSRHISPSLRADALILTEIYEKIFAEPPGSFS